MSETRAYLCFFISRKTLHSQPGKGPSQNQFSHLLTSDWFVYLSRAWVADGGFLINCSKYKQTSVRGEGGGVRYYGVSEAARLWDAAGNVNSSGTKSISSYVVRTADTFIVKVWPVGHVTVPHEQTYDRQQCLLKHARPKTKREISLGYFTPMSCIRCSGPHAIQCPPA